MSALLEFIESRLETPRPDCMIWPDAVDRGYGRIWLEGSARRVHRVVWELTNGPIPDGMTIDHLCRIRACCNPEHMELVTQAENTRRRRPARGLMPGQVRATPVRRAPLKTHCLRDHEFTPENTFLDDKGARVCRECSRMRQRRSRSRAKDVGA